MTAPSPETLERFAAIVGAKNALRPNETDLTRYTQENRHILIGRTPMVLRPGSTEEIAAIVRLANDTRIALVPQGGHTGHVAGGAPDETGTQIVVAMERMNRLRDVDLAGNTITVEAGMLLQRVQEIAAEHDRLFPLSLASQGSCQIGGNISSNAGGVAVLAYGNTRDLVLGLEVVLANGEIWNGLRKLKKDNTGYALRHLFIGAEGTLGIVTAATLKLFARPKGKEVVFAGMATPGAALELLNAALAAAGPSLTTFELIHRTPLDFTLAHIAGARDPLARRHEWYVLAEFSSGRSADDARKMAETIFQAAIENSVIDDAVLAGSLAQQNQFWKLREDMPGAQAFEGGSIKHDISLPVHRIPEFLRQASPVVERAYPGAQVCCFGHMGDGNLHYNVSQPKGGDTKAFLAAAKQVNEAVHEIVIAMEGSVSAEHGVGRLKRDLVARAKSPVEIEMMRTLKRAFDPNGIMNPGKVVQVPK
jgi:FAD/FMN-containing dehydrogenase